MTVKYVNASILYFHNIDNKKYDVKSNKTVLAMSPS